MKQSDRNALVEENLGLATYYARHYSATAIGIDFEDLLQEARIGLINAAERYDPARGKFSTFAAFHVMERIYHAMRTTGRTIRVPRNTPHISLALLGESVPMISVKCKLGEQLDEKTYTDFVRECIAKLDHREGVVIRLRHGIGTPRITLESASAIVGVSGERVRQIQVNAEKKLRQMFLESATLLDHDALPSGDEL